MKYGREPIFQTSNRRRNAENSIENYMQILDGDPFLIKEKHLNYMDAENKLYQPPYFLLLLLIE